MDNKARILFLDDEVGVVNTLRAIFRQKFEVHIATSPAAALELIRQSHFHVVVSDQRMPDILGVDFLKQVKEISPNSVRILLTGYSDLTAIVGSINSGEVFRFINKPWDHQEIKETIGLAADIGIKTMSAPVLPATVVDEPVAVSGEKRQQIMVLDDDENLAIAVKKIFTDLYEVHHAPNIDQALKLLERHDIAVIISELEVGNQSSIPLLRTLKEQYPLILTVMLTDLSDSALIIKLINQVRIYRFANKPIRVGALQLSVKAAIRQYKMYAHNPELLVSQAAEKVSAVEAEAEGLKKSIFDSLRLLTSRFRFFRPA